MVSCVTFKLYEMPDMAERISQYDYQTWQAVLAVLLFKRTKRGWGRRSQLHKALLP